MLKFSKNGYVILIEDSNDCTGPEYVPMQKSHSSRIVKKFECVMLDILILGVRVFLQMSVGHFLSSI